MAGIFAGLNPISLIASGAQTALGIGQTIAGFTQKKPKLAEYDIPPEVLVNMSQAQKLQYEGLPEAQKQQFIQNIQRAGASALSSSTSRKGGLGLVASVAQQQGDEYMNLLSADTTARMNNIDRLFNARSAMAAEREKKFQIKRENILQKRGEIDKMRGAGMQNIMSSLGSVAEMGLGNSFKATTTSKKPIDNEYAGN